MPTPAPTELKTIETDKKSIELIGSEDYGHMPYPDELNKHSKSVIQKSSNEKGSPTVMKVSNTAQFQLLSEQKRSFDFTNKRKKEQEA